MKSIAITAAFVAAACGGAPARPQAESDGLAVDTPPDPARVVLDQLEQRLLGATALELTAQITAEGHIGAALEGTLLIDGDRVLLGFEGAFAGQDVQLSLAADSATMSGSNGRLGFAHERPAALGEGLLLGLTRMGILHNLAVLASGNPPQGTFGGVRDWVRVLEVRRAEDHLAFEIEVNGKRVANARLYLDAETGLPTRREQTVRFPAGTMTVVETYSTFSVR